MVSLLESHKHKRSVDIILAVDGLRSCVDQFLFSKSVFTHVTSSHANLLEQKEVFMYKKRDQLHRISLGDQHGRSFNVLGHQYGCSNVMDM